MKRLLLILSMAACIFSISACGRVEESSQTIDAEIVASMEQVAASMFETFYQSDDATLEIYLLQVRAAKDTVYVNAFESWLNLKDELGRYVSTKGITVTKVEKGYEAALSAVFEKRELTFSLVVNEDFSELTSMQFEAKYTTGERMQKAALNTLLGMGSVFVVLILIIAVISSFKYISKFENRNNKKQDLNELPPDHEGEIVTAIERTADAAKAAKPENLTDDRELVAIITAAIAASSDVAADGLVVRSIKRVQNSKWKNA